MSFEAMSVRGKVLAGTETDFRVDDYTAKRLVKYEWFIDRLHQSRPSNPVRSCDSLSEMAQSLLSVIIKLLCNQLIETANSRLSGSARLQSRFSKGSGPTEGHDSMQCLFT